MKLLFGIAITSLLLTACSPGLDRHDFKFPDPPPSQDVVNAQAREAFRQLPAVEALRAAGLELDCEAEICGKVTAESLRLIDQYKASFLDEKHGIGFVFLVKEKLPYYDEGGRKGAYVPFEVSETVLQDFFQVLQAIETLQEHAGMKFSFPNNYYSKAIIEPLLQIFRAHLSELRTESSRIKTVIVSSVYLGFDSRDGSLMFKRDHLRQSFADTWKFFSHYFKAQDLFGSVAFEFSDENHSDLHAMDLFFQNKQLFQPLFQQLQGRKIVLLPSEGDSYAQSTGFFYDILLSSSHDEKYLQAVLQDYARTLRLSNFIAVDVFSWQGYVDLETHGACLDKVEIVQNDIKAKGQYLKKVITISEAASPHQPSNFKDHVLTLNCDQTAEEFKAVIATIH